jgi:hypothetical protein
MKATTTTYALAATAALLLLSLYAGYVSAAPGGASIIFNETAGVPTTTPSNRSDARGTITTIILDSVQQDQQWKAYVGNITGKLSLDDAAGNTIYDWALAGVNKSGEVYVTRHASPNWANISCASASNITVEEEFHNMTATQTDSISSTFSVLSHAAFYVGTTPIGNNTCPSTATYVSSLAQTLDGTQVFQELILRDNADQIIFTTLVTGNYSGFDDLSYDFQIIVPESDVKTEPTLYYFFTELSG